MQDQLFTKFQDNCRIFFQPQPANYKWIIIGADRRPETKQGIEGKIVRFRSGRVRNRDNDRKSEAINFGTC